MGANVIERPDTGESKLVQWVTERLIDQIVAGEIENGHRIPDLADLAGAHGAPERLVSRALSLVGILGFIETDEEGNASVCADGVHAFVQSLQTLRRIDGPVLARLMVTLSYVEPSLASLAASNATQQDLIDLRDALRRSAYAAEDRQADNAGQDAWFHELIGRAAQTPLYAQIVTTIRLFLTQPRPILHVVASRDVRGVEEQHNRIYQAIKDRDPRSSYEAMQAHLAHWMACNVDLIRDLYRWGANGEAKRKRNGMSPSRSGAAHGGAGAARMAFPS